MFLITLYFLSAHWVAVQPSCELQVENLSSLNHHWSVRMICLELRLFDLCDHSASHHPRNFSMPPDPLYKCHYHFFWAHGCGVWDCKSNACAAIDNKNNLISIVFSGPFKRTNVQWMRYRSHYLWLLFTSRLKSWLINVTAVCPLNVCYVRLTRYRKCLCQCIVLGIRDDCSRLDFLQLKVVKALKAVEVTYI